MIPPCWVSRRDPCLQGLGFFFFLEGSKVVACCLIFHCVDNVDLWL